MINQEEEDGVDITKYTLTEEGNAKYITPAEFIFSFHRLSGYVLTSVSTCLNISIEIWNSN